MTPQWFVWGKSKATAVLGFKTDVAVGHLRRHTASFSARQRSNGTLSGGKNEMRRKALTSGRSKQDSRRSPALSYSPGNGAAKLETRAPFWRLSQRSKRHNRLCWSCVTRRSKSHLPHAWWYYLSSFNASGNEKTLAPVASYKLSRGTAQKKLVGTNSATLESQVSRRTQLSHRGLGCKLRGSLCVFQQVWGALSQSLADMALRRASWMEKRHQKGNDSTTPLKQTV